MANVLIIDPGDSVAVALSDLAPGEALYLAEGVSLKLAAAEAIPFGHKVAVRSISKGERIIKYGASIGLATDDIAPGQHVHIHNLISVRGAVQR